MLVDDDDARRAAVFGALRSQLAHRACHARASSILLTFPALVCKRHDNVLYMHDCRHGVQLCWRTSSLRQRMAQLCMWSWALRNIIKML